MLVFQEKHFNHHNAMLPIHKHIRIAMAQANFKVGDIEGNAKKILSLSQSAKELGASVLVTPEMALSGYPPEDLLLRPAFLEACTNQLLWLKEQVRNIMLIVGHPAAEGGQIYNRASVIHQGKIMGSHDKVCLPNEAVFDECRYFRPGAAPLVVDVDGLLLGVLICEDIWRNFPAQMAKANGAEALVVLNASPFHLEKHNTRLDIAKQAVMDTKLPLAFVNLVGGQDELVFDGASFVLDQSGAVMVQLPQFHERLGFVDFINHEPQPGEMAALPAYVASAYEALCLGLRDYIQKNNFPGVIVGASGGVDSSLTLAIAADALGPQKVWAVSMPSVYTSGMSRTDARTLAANLAIRFDELEITAPFESFVANIQPLFTERPPDTTEENIQARMRGMILMALSNKFGPLVITTGNKSEMATGYATLYGDMAGGFALLKDAYKTLVYDMARYRNSLSPVIPERVLTRPPSAELRPDQRDEDSLLPYPVLDKILEAYIEGNKSNEEIIAMGFAREDVLKVGRLLRYSEYKRKQAPLGVRLTNRGFGKDWRYPITHDFAF
jgi:NAD+ synthase (glutamine-hydrolysing)